MNKVELLAPAGNYECFLAAIHAGADAIYLGGEKYGARAYADNFSVEEIVKALDYSHIFNKKIYLTVNTVAKNIEVDELVDYITPLYIAGLDGVIVQDIGVVSLLKRVFPNLPIHASTQMAVTDAEAVKLLKQSGIERIVPARELSLSEIKNIKDKTGIEIECFIHGAMCYSYSGKCLFSSFLGDRSGNRGRCAGTCRLAYDNKYILSMKDMCTIDILPELINAGIDSFKIEGRMKSKEYVAGVTGIYRKYIDLIYSGKEYIVDEEDKNNLIKLYTRGGNCQGYYKQYNGKNMLTINKAGYETADNDKALEIYNEYNNGLNRRISAYVSVASDGTYMSVYDDDNSVTVNGPIPQKSVSKPLTHETIYKQINKIGDKPFEFESIDINIEDSLFLSIAELNKLRRDALDSFYEEICVKYHRDEAQIYREFKNKIGRVEYDKTTCFNNYHCMLFSLSQLESVLEFDYINIVSVNFDAFCEENNTDIGLLIKNTCELIHEKNKLFYLTLPYIIRNNFFEKNDYLKDAILNYTDGVVVDNYESIEFLNEIFYEGEIVGDLHLYALNKHAVSKYNSYGINTLTLPVELNRKELKHLADYNYEVIKYGRIPLVVSAQCIKKTLDKCDKIPGIGFVTDRKNKQFIFMNRCRACYNLLLNSVPTYLSNDDIFSLDLSYIRYRIMFTNENGEEVRQILNLIMTDDSPKFYTKGHFNRGVE